MRRLLGFLLRNWPLKLGAVVLSTLLYAGLVLSQNARTFTGPVPIDFVNPPDDVTVLDALPPVTRIQYRAPVSVGVVSPATFRAFVDLSNVEPREDGGAVSLPVDLRPIDRDIEVIDFQPQTVQVRVDRVVTRSFPVTVDHGPVPEGLDIGTPVAAPTTVRVSGASSEVGAVQAVVARVAIDGSALNVDREVDVSAVDGQGIPLDTIQLDPERVRVEIAVARQLATRILPVAPQLVGSPPQSYRVRSITVDPVVVTVRGDVPVVTRLESARTAPVDIGGRTSEFTTGVPLALPPDVTAADVEDVRVHVVIEPVSGSRTFEAGVTLRGAAPDLTYRLATSSVLVVLDGPLPVLDAAAASAPLAVADVSGLEPGTHNVRLLLEPPEGLRLLSVDPPRIEIAVAAAPSSPVPASPSPAP